VCNIIAAAGSLMSVLVHIKLQPPCANLISDSWSNRSQQHADIELKSRPRRYMNFASRCSQTNSSANWPWCWCPSVCVYVRADLNWFEASPPHAYEKGWTPPLSEYLRDQQQNINFGHAHITLEFCGWWPQNMSASIAHNIYLPDVFIKCSHRDLKFRSN
jgi:hypothetical protein